MENQNSTTLENSFEEILKSMKEIIHETRKELQNSINEEFKQIMDKLGDLKASNEIALKMIQELKVTLPDDEEIDSATNGSEGDPIAPEVEDYIEFQVRIKASKFLIHPACDQFTHNKVKFLPETNFVSHGLAHNTAIRMCSSAGKGFDEMPRSVLNCGYAEKEGYLYVITNQYLPKYNDSGGRAEIPMSVISGIALLSGSSKLYTGSKDETVRVWNCQFGQGAGVINLVGEVGCMFNEGPWVFVGLPKVVKERNAQTATVLSLSRLVGQVYALVVGNDLLFAGTQDGTKLSWKFNVVSNSFEPAALLKGHIIAFAALFPFFKDKCGEVAAIAYGREKRNTNNCRKQEFIFDPGGVIKNCFFLGYVVNSSYSNLTIDHDLHIQRSLACMLAEKCLTSSYSLVFILVVLSLTGCPRKNFIEMIDAKLFFAFFMQKLFMPQWNQHQCGHSNSGFNSSVADQEAVLETVAKITHEKMKKNETQEANVLDSEGSEVITTLIDKRDNMFVMSKKKLPYLVFQVDLRLISNLEVVIVFAEIGGIIFSCLGQPVIVEYLLAGSLIGPGGLKFITKLVQGETVAPFGVVFLLFALGLEFPLTKLKAVGPIIVLGGQLQIVIFMFMCGVIAMFCGIKLLVVPFLPKFLIPADINTYVTKTVNDYYGVLMTYDSLVDFRREQKPGYTTNLIQNRVLPWYNTSTYHPYLVASVNWVLGEFAPYIPEEMNVDVYSSLLKALALSNMGNISCYPVRVSATGVIAELVENEYLPPEWLHVLQVMVGRVGDEDKESFIIFQLLSTLVEAGNKSVTPHIPYIVSLMVGTISKYIPTNLEPWPQMVERGFAALAVMTKCCEGSKSEEAEENESNDIWVSGCATIATTFSGLLQQVWLRPLQPVEVWFDLIADWHEWEEMEKLSIFSCIKEVVSLNRKVPLKNFIVGNMPSPPAPPVPQPFVFTISVAQEIGSEAKFQNDAINQLQMMLIKAQAGVKNNMRKLNTSIIQSGSSHVVHVVLFALVLFLVVYMLSKFSRR